MLARQFKTSFDSFIATGQKLRILRHEQMLHSVFASVAQTLDAAKVSQFIAGHFVITPFIPPDRVALVTRRKSRGVTILISSHPETFPFIRQKMA